MEEVLRRAYAPLTIYTDSAAVVNAFLKGKAYACREGNDGADIWRRIWAILEDFGECQILKIKAHTTAEDAQEGLIDPYKQAGNATADFFAVQARKSAEAEAPCRSFEQQYARARAWYGHILAGIGDWQIDTHADAEAGPAQEDAPPSASQLAGARAAATRKHSVWVLNGVARCMTCGNSFAAPPSAVAKRMCRGPLPTRVLQSLGLRQSPEDAHAHTVAEMQAMGATPWRPEPLQTPPEADEVIPVPVRRRLRGKQPPPPATVGVARAAVLRKEVESQHLLVTKGRVTYCERCGRWAIDRISLGLQRKCAGSVETKLGAYRVRRDRLRAGRHPLTGRLLDQME